MLSINDENRIRNMVDGEPGISDKSLSTRVNVSRVAVRRVRETIKAIKKLGVSKAEGIKGLILAGVPDGAIASEAIVSREDVQEVRFFYFLQKRNSGNKKDTCPTCGSLMFSEEYQKASKAEKKTGRILPPEISEAQAAKMYRIIVDLVELDRLCIVTNPLFHFLAKRAGPILGELHGKEKKNQTP